MDDDLISVSDVATQLGKRKQTAFKILSCFKVGFAVSLPERLRSLKCSAPFLKVVASWP